MPHTYLGISKQIASSILLLVGVGAALLPPSSSAPASTRVLHAAGNVVINEIAWMGTGAATSDEWLELHNTTTTAIGLDGWTVAAQDGIPTIHLSGSIPANGFFLLERTDDTTIANIPADQIYTGALANTGESLTLTDAEGAIIDTANADGGEWPAGDNSLRASMERINPRAGDVTTNWAANDGITRNGCDANGDAINGTPRAINSAVAAAGADLVISKTGPVTATAGAAISYTITLLNAGSLPATGNRVTDTLPLEVTFMESVPPPTAITGQNVMWTLAPLELAAIQQITLTVAVTPGIVGTFTNEATATTATPETATANNHSAWAVTVGGSPPPDETILINAILFDGYQLNDPDEAVQLVNTSANPVPLNGWTLCKVTTSLSCRDLPAITLPAGQTVWLTRDAMAFRTSFGFDADYVLSPWLSSGLSNLGDEVILRDQNGQISDALVYGSGNTNIAGWSGEALQSYGNDVARAEGQILQRIPDEVRGLPLSDTNTQNDWMQNLTDPFRGRRAVFPGWDFVDPLFWTTKASASAELHIGILPDNGYEVIRQVLSTANSSIDIEAYEFNHGGLLNLLVAKAQQGVAVRLLLEGDQVGVGEHDDSWQQELYACQQLEAAGGQCYFMIHESGERIFNRYTHLHAKLVVVDNVWAIVSSQNFSNRGLPSDPKENGTCGSRGTIIATTSPASVARAAEIFALDCDAAHHNDILRWNTEGYTKYGLPTTTPDLGISDSVSYTVRFAEPFTTTGAIPHELFTAPEAALRQSDALLGLLSLAGAGDRIYVEQLYEHAVWGNSGNPAVEPNPRLESYISAARRGAQVRILLNGGYFDQEFLDLVDNRATLAYLQALARTENLDLEAALGNPTQYGIHNKMALVWIEGTGGFVHIGSINGSENSNKANREIALQVQNNAAFAYLEAMFQLDWNLSNPVLLPLLLHTYEIPDRLLISEVYYATSNTNAEWVEILNPTTVTFDLSGYWIGDAAAAGDYEGMYGFPEGARIAPGAVAVVAVSGSMTPAADFEIVDDSEKPDMVKLTSWGTGNWTLANGGDQILLLGPGYAPIDVVVWGAAMFPGALPHPGVSVSSASLERYPPDADTDNCATDFRERALPNPGELPIP